MRLALREARRAGAEGEVPVGAVLVAAGPAFGVVADKDRLAHGDVIGDGGGLGEARGGLAVPAGGPLQATVETGFLAFASRHGVVSFSFGVRDPVPGTRRTVTRSAVILRCVR